MVLFALQTPRVHQYWESAFERARYIGSHDKPIKPRVFTPSAYPNIYISGYDSNIPIIRIQEICFPL